MKVCHTIVTKIEISELDRLDPISVTLEDFAPGKGKINIDCWGQAWSAYWGGMSGRTIAEFFVSCDEDYLAGKLFHGQTYVPDYNALHDKAKARIVGRRRRFDITATEARELFDRLEVVPECDCDIDSELMHRIFGSNEWWFEIPNTLSHEYQYLRRIVKAVKDALACFNPSKPDLKRLSEIGTLINSQNNRCTEAPIFIVEQRVRDWGYDPAYSDQYGLVDNSDPDSDAVDPDDADEILKRIADVELVSTWKKVYYKDRWQFVTACLTEQGCNEYLARNGHNLGVTRIYAAGSHRNQEWRDVRKALMAMSRETNQDVSA